MIPGRHKGEKNMSDKGSKDIGKKEQKKKAQHTLKEKRKLKKQKGEIAPLNIPQ
jgi:hypothetical protein